MVKNMKRIKIIIAVLTAAILLAGCGETQPNQPDNTTTAPPETTAAPVTTQTTPAETTTTEPAQTTGTITDLLENAPAAANIITEDQARQIALQHAGIADTDVTNIWINAERDDGILIYDVDFYAAGKEYSYDIDAADGSILSFDVERDERSAMATAAVTTTAAATLEQSVQIPEVTTTTTTTATTQAQPANNPISTEITEAEATAIALQHAGVAEADAVRLYTHLDRDDGRYVYDVEFYADGYEYSYEIDPKNGDIIAFDKELERMPAATTATTTNADLITEARAAQIALEHAGFAEADVQRLTARLDRDDGRRVYEVSFRVGRTEYDYDIDAATGNILSYDQDYDD
jgi:uncharacterized membrane protein YkoI